MKKKDNLLLLDLKGIYDNYYLPDDETRFLSPDIGFVRSFQGIIQLAKSFFRLQQPYRITEGRIVYFRSGRGKLRIDLQEIEITGKQLIIASPGTIFEFMEISENLDLSMLAFSNELMEGWIKEDLLQTFMQGRLIINTNISETFIKRIEKIFDLLWDTLHDNNYSKDEIRSLIFILFHQISINHKHETADNDIRETRQKEIFNKFLYLINKHAIKERNLTFYAEKLFITPRYLSTLIKLESGRTVMNWINDATIQEIKIQLRHTDKPIYYISDEMNFPNPSFFTKYFRRLTGMTPKEYKEKIHTL